MTAARSNVTSLPARKRATKASQSLQARLMAAKVAMDEAKARYDALAVKAREELTFGNHAKDGVVIQVQHNRTWNKARALELYGDEIVSPQVDQKLAAKKLTGDQYDDLYDEGAPKITVALQK